MTDPVHLIRQAQQLLKTTTVGYTNSYWKTPPATSSWARSMTLLDAAIQAIMPTPPPPPVAAKSSIGLLRNAAIDPIPADMSGYQYVILNPTFAPKVAAWAAQYPKTKFLAYKDPCFAVTYSTDNYGNAAVPFLAMQDQWFLKNIAGQKVQSVNYSGNLYFADVGDPSYQDACYTYLKSFLSDWPGYAGFFLDDCAPDMAWHLGGQFYNKLAKYPTRNTYRAALRGWLVSVCGRLRADGLLTCPNIGAAWDQADVWADWAKICGMAMREHFCRWDPPATPFLAADWKLHTDAMRAVVSVGAAFIGLSYGNAAETSAQTYLRATFLLFHEPGSAFIWGQNGDPTWLAWTKDLGAPVAAAVQSGSIWTRQFEQGIVRVDTANGTASF